MEFIEDLYFNYIQDLSTEGREELLSMLDDFFSMPDGYFSSKFNTYTYVDEAEEDIKQVITREYAAQYAVDCEHFKLDLGSILEMLSSAKYWLVYEYFKVADHTTLEKLKKDMAEHETKAVEEYAKFYKVWQKKPKPKKRNSKVIDFNSWRERLSNEKLPN